MSPALVAFRPHFVNAVKYLSAEVANVYITGGELILDVALLRSINDYVHDPMSESAMELVNRDESRHIAVDYHMAEDYASPAYQEWLSKQPPQPLARRLKALWAFTNVLYIQALLRGRVLHAHEDGRSQRRRLRGVQALSAPRHQAGRRQTLLSSCRPSETWRSIRSVAPFGGAMSRLAGVPPELMRDMYTEGKTRPVDELRRAGRRGPRRQIVN